jgi:hypothetical protein
MDVFCNEKILYQAIVSTFWVRRKKYIIFIPRKNSSKRRSFMSCFKMPEYIFGLILDSEKDSMKQKMDYL